MDIEIVKMSSKGQFVMPLSLRKRLGIGKGEKLMFVESKGTVVVKPIKELGDDLEDELYMMRRAARGWEQVEKGRGKKMSKKEALAEMSKW